MRCVLCGDETKGSIGAAGIRWPNICQVCKDLEDDFLRRQVQAQAQVLKEVFNEITTTKKDRV